MIGTGKQTKSFDAERYFFKQVIKLKREYHTASGLGRMRFLDKLASAHRQVLKMREAIEDEALRDNGRFPFLLVIPAAMMPVTEQLARIETENGESGIARFWVDIPGEVGTSAYHEPYIIVDVEDGTETRGLSPIECGHEFEKNQRLGLTIEEGIAMITQFPWVIKSHNIDLVGSSNSQGHVVSISEDGKAVVAEISHPMDGDDAWGSPSCRFRAYQH